MFHEFIITPNIPLEENDIVNLFITGLRFDLKIAGIFILLFLMIASIFCWFEWSWHLLKKIFLASSVLVVFIMTLLSFASYNYLKTFNHNFDVFVYNFLSENKTAILEAAWQNYPILKGITCALVLSLLTMSIIKKLLLIPLSPIRYRTKFIVLIVCYFIILLLFSRGSFDSFPLRKQHINISTNPIVNDLVPNPISALWWSYRDYQNKYSFVPVTQEESRTLLNYFGHIVQHSTPVNSWISRHPPNVVFILTESLGSNILEIGAQTQNNFLGKLDNHWQKDFIFNRFLSEKNGTTDSLEAIFFHSPYPHLSTSIKKNIPLKGTPFWTYKEAGYKTIFICSKSMNWENLDQYLKVQGVDKIYDLAYLKKKYPESSQDENSYGVLDEYAFKLAKSILLNAKKPVFISVLTLTNHPPFKLPHHYSQMPINHKEHFKKYGFKTKNDFMQLQTYRYTTDLLGEFLDFIKTSPQTNNTIVAITGDHKARNVSMSYPKQLVLMYAVPFYLYVPHQLLNHVNWHYDPSRVGSHKDIFPTLYAFSLSNQKYNSLCGRNMLSRIDLDACAFGYNEKLWITSKGVFPLDLENPIFFKWNNNRSLLVNTNLLPTPYNQSKKFKYYKQLLDWQLNYQTTV
ncbi:LTA synthase family protein [Legionella bononiensis]|nr:alkaline phosphatase family protein [Legionella bononiensis]MBL7479687.1 sulfatase-like hydrolase/transferase [Legionella bononiensis]MBL7561983.1 sulfatase-like hydrolase/transferase [Legionella bononiensis]